MAFFINCFGNFVSTDNDDDDDAHRHTKHETRTMFVHTSGHALCAYYMCVNVSVCVCGERKLA